MRIGIDGIPLTGAKTGVGHYTLELARGLAQIADTDSFEFVTPARILSGDSKRDEWPANLSVTYREPNSLRKHWWTIGLPLYIRQSSLDLFHGTNYNVPLWEGCPTVLTIHDLSLFLYPETHEKHRVSVGLRRIPTMGCAATKIITPSQAVRREVVEHLNVSPEKVIAIPEAARREFRPMPAEETRDARKRFGIEDDFLLYVGTLEPRKNLMLLVRAFEEVLCTTNLRPQLVIVGKKGWLVDELFAYVERAELGDRLLFTNYVTDEELRALYSSCRMCIYPSLYEGFGLPPLEAMACGAPVITTRIPSIMETVGDAARLVEPTDVDALARNIIDLLADAEARATLSAAGLARAAQFSWEKTARMTLEVYREMLGQEQRA
ncbi:MAG: glycosyltransferase family 4 protein [Pyrinomonadaceae bacterium]|jgi:glycosyltransferase involved in cell wall biosynthesis|nr:glycosyltransferase family 4 protein [Pyrinomonadaceae bacterium]